MVETRQGDEPHEVLSLFDHDPKVMVEKFRERVQEAVAKRTLAKSKVAATVREYEKSLRGSTYLDFGA